LADSSQPVLEQSGEPASHDPALQASKTAPGAGSPLTIGQRWHAYQIGDAVPCAEGWCYQAVNIGLLEDAIIHVVPFNEAVAARAEAWKILLEMKHPGLVEPLEAVEENGYRFETYKPSPALTLREWASAHRPGLDAIEGLVAQLSATVHALHERGLGHFNLSPETIHLVHTDAGMQTILGGLGHAALCQQSALVPLIVDPLYAPPEAAGLTKHQSGPGLLAWDWWSLGRIMQELVLGSHVLDIVIDRSIARTAPEYRNRAEDLLMERIGTGTRAGAVERMPPMEDRLVRLLRGLLASSRDARWSYEEVKGWLRREEVKERYHLPRGEKLFRYKNRCFTVPETAEFFSREANWADGVDQLFDLKNPASLVVFLGHEPAHAHVRHQLDELRELMQLPSWRELPIEIVRSAIAAISWLHLADAGARLTVFGRKVDAAGLKALLTSDPRPAGLALVRAITAAPFVQLIATRDGESARFLGHLDGSANEALALGAKTECLTETAPADQTRVYLCALQTDAQLTARRDELRALYACSRHQALDRILHATQLTRKELILLSCVADEPERFGFVTKLDWSRDRYMALRERGEQIVAHLFWVNLAQALRLGPLVFGRWPWILILWGALGVCVAVAGRQPWSSLAGSTLIAVLLGLRIGVCALQRQRIASQAPGSAPWTLLSARSRCHQEATTAIPGQAPAPTELLEELRRVNREIAALALEPKPSPLPQPSRAQSTWAASIAGWVLAGLVLLWSGLSRFEPRFAPSHESSAVSDDLLSSKAPTPGKNALKPKPELSAEERFFGNPQLQNEPWTFSEPSTVPRLTVTGYVTPTAQQIAAGLVDGQRLLYTYIPSQTQGVVAVPVAHDGSPAFLLYDARKRQLVERRIYRVATLPAVTPTWYQLDDRKVLYLGPPPPLLATGAYPKIRDEVSPFDATPRFSPLLPGDRRLNRETVNLGP
jgi:hypothetical protein